MKKVWFIAIMAICMALETGCGRYQAAGEPDSEETVSVAEKSGVGEDWFDVEYTVDLHTFGREWTRVSETIGGRTIDKEVRETGGNGT